MDPFEEFEFKPLTDGLGFHKRKSQPSSYLSTQPETSRSQIPDLIKDQGLELIEESSADPLRSPLPRKTRQQNIKLPQLPTENLDNGSSAVDEILKTLQKNRRFELENEKAKVMAATPPKEVYKASFWSFSAALLDSMLVTAAGLLCLIILLVITKTDLVSSLTKPDTGVMIYFATGSIFALVSVIYLITNRIFVGCTPGEWAFDQRVGLPEQLNTIGYSSRILLRTLVTVVTGFILLPLASLLLQKDLAGELSGAKLYKKS